MIVVRSRQALEEALADARKSLLDIAFVPTMGNLHDGHISLVRAAAKMADLVVVSIFVNPLQFGPNEDFDDYPRTFEDDCKHLTSAGVAVLFYPGVDEIYPEGMENHSTVTVPNLTDLHCGAARPGHFDGVTTVVMKLLNMVRPKVALFGKKDYQQLAVIRKMADDFCLPVSIFGVDTCREASGLALSSRNQYLTPEERAIAPQLNRHLRSLASRMQAGEECRTALENTLAALKALGFSVDYLSLADSKTLIPVPTPVTGQSLVLLVAAKLGKTRLIDNLEWICP